MMMLVARCVKQQLEGEELEMAAGKLEKAMKGYIWCGGGAQAAGESLEGEHGGGGGAWLALYLL